MKSDKRGDAIERLREDVVFDCLFTNPNEYSKKEIGRESDWERIPKGEPWGRVITRMGKLFSVVIPVKRFYQLARKRGVSVRVVKDTFSREMILLRPHSRQKWCYEVRINRRAV